GFLVVAVAQNRDQPERIASACFAAMRQVAVGGSGPLLQATLFALTVAATSALAILGWRLSRSMGRARALSHRHAAHARIIGRPVAGLDAVVVDAPERVAYSVAGRPDTIVVTSAALDALDECYLDAVLAHERAHLSGRHHLMLALTRALAVTLPRVALFTIGAREIARLTEMAADDAAARRHGPDTVLGALLALSVRAPVPSCAAAATGTDVLARAERLAVLARAERLATPLVAGWHTRLMLGAMTLLVVLVPLVVGVHAAIGFGLCNPMGADGQTVAMGSAQGCGGAPVVPHRCP
ncbi:MAG TPA: M56 family metallopeptidase, partial [Mycobacterium sp.]|nr:M56 family metallopeptidase [Mycobacterium sp.]